MGIVINKSETIPNLYHIAVSNSLCKDTDKLNVNEIMTLPSLKQAVCLAAGVRWDEIVSKDRHVDPLDARHIFVYIAVERLGMSQKSVAKVINRDRTTMFNSLKRTRTLIKAKDKKIVSLLEEVLKRM